MDYLAQLNAFADYSSENLRPNEFCVYMNMLFLNNRLHWKEWFSVTCERLSVMTGISSRTILEIVNSLSQKGYIEVKKNPGKKPNSYRIIPLYGEEISCYPAEKLRTTCGQSADNLRESCGKDRPIIKRDNKRKDIISSADSPRELTPAEEEVKSAFEGTFHPLTKLEELDALCAYTGEYGSRAVVEAIKRADKSVKDPGKRLHLSPRYLLPVLQNPESSRGAGPEPAVRDIVPPRPRFKPVTVEDILERRAKRERGEEVECGAYWIQGEPPPWETVPKKPEPGGTKKDWFDVIKAVPK